MHQVAQHDADDKGAAVADDQTSSCPTATEDSTQAKQPRPMITTSIYIDKNPITIKKKSY